MIQTATCRDTNNAGGGGGGGGGGLDDRESGSLLEPGEILHKPQQCVPLLNFSSARTAKLHPSLAHSGMPGGVVGCLQEFGIGTGQVVGVQVWPTGSGPSIANLAAVIAQPQRLPETHGK